MRDDPKTAEFYIGWTPEPPPRLARRLRRIVLGLLALSLVLAALLVFGQRPFAAASFAYGMSARFTGRVQLSPGPFLWVGDGEGQRGLFLVAPGKHGATPFLAGLDGRAVELRGTSIERDATTMIEVEPGSIVARADGAPSLPASAALGWVTLRGEIVDGKCYLGVMNPGEGKPHRDCAARCIAGGVPPLLVARGPEGGEMRILLAAPDGGPLGPDLLDFVAEPVTVTGELPRHDDHLVLHAAVADIHRLGAVPGAAR